MQGLLMKSNRLVVMALMTMAFNFTYADNLTDGLTFANSIAPSALGQVVNPSAVNATAWSSNGASTSVPIATPIGLGTFSAPTTSSTIMSPSNPIGVLSNLGNQAITDCETYVPTGNPMLDQRCAAVNFMSNKCVTPTNTQNAVLGAAGTSVASSAACAGTYGQGAANFGFNNQITSSDNIFTAVNSAQTNATANTQSNCSTQQVVTKPAEYSNNQCAKSSNAQINKCNKVLNVAAVFTYIPPPPCVIPPWYGAPLGFSLAGNMGLSTNYLNGYPFGQIEYYCYGTPGAIRLVSAVIFVPGWLCDATIPTDGQPYLYCHVGPSPYIDYYASISCDNGGQCHIHVTSSGSNIYISNPPPSQDAVITNPAGYTGTTFSESWDDQCQAYEASAP